MKLGVLGDLRKSPAISLLSHYVTQQVTYDQPVLAPLEALKRVLSKPTKERTTKALQFLLNFTKGIKFFTELGEEAHYQCCLHMTYNFTPSGEVLFHQGDPGSQFFVLLSGKCGVLISDAVGNFSEVLVYQTGDSFGELALMKNQPRAATILCKTDCHFGVLEREGFMRIIGKIKEAKLQRKIDFLQKFSFFQHWTKSSLMRLSYHFTERVYKRKQMVFCEDDESTEVYFITNGEFQLMQTLHLPGAANALNQRRNNLKVQAEVTVLTVDQCFGEEDILDGGRRRFSCMCRSEVGEVLVLTREDFVKRVNGEETINLIRKMNERKTQLREQRLKAIASLETLKKSTPVTSPSTSPLSQPSSSLFSHLVHYHKQSRMDALTLAVSRFQREVRQTQRSESPEARHQSPPLLYPAKSPPTQSPKVPLLAVEKTAPIRIKRAISTAKSEHVVNIHTARLHRSKTRDSSKPFLMPTPSRPFMFQPMPMNVVSLESRRGRNHGKTASGGWLTSR